MQTEAWRINQRFNEMQSQLASIVWMIDSLYKYAETYNIDLAEIIDLNQDAKTLARRIDRLHHDFAADPVARLALRRGG